jgi:hypothetical protein
VETDDDFMLSIRAFAPLVGGEHPVTRRGFFREVA